jgi:hypothetical protein
MNLLSFLLFHSLFQLRSFIRLKQLPQCPLLMKLEFRRFNLVLLFEEDFEPRRI